MKEVYKLTFEQLEQLNFTSVTDLCRMMVESGTDKAYSGIEVYRGDMKCLIVNNITEAAKLYPDGSGFREYRPSRRRNRK